MDNIEPDVAHARTQNPHYGLPQDQFAPPPQASSKSNMKTRGIRASKSLIIFGVVAIAAIIGISAALSTEAEKQSTDDKAPKSDFSFPPKMIATFSMNASGFAPGVPEDGVEPIDSNIFTAQSLCSTGQPFEFSISAGSGSIEVMILADDSELFIEFVNQNEDGEIVPVESSEGLFEYLIGDNSASGYSTLSASYTVESASGAAVRISCQEAVPTSLTVVTSDDSEVTVSANITRALFSPNDIASGSIGTNSAVISFSDVGFNDIEVLSGDDRHGMRRLSSTEMEIRYRGLAQDEISNVQLAVTTSSGSTVFRTLAFNDRVEIQPQTVTLSTDTLNENGDIDLKFSGTEFTGSAELKLQVRLGIKVGSTTYACVDTAAYVRDSSIQIHADWLNVCAEEFDISAESCETTTCDLVILEVVESDPDDRYVAVGRSSGSVALASEDSRRLLGDTLRRRRLTGGAVDIHLDMLQGRPPALKESNRRLQSRSIHRKILVHGYCAGDSPFPANHFENDLAFKEPGNKGSGWSNNDFANRIGAFLEANDLGYGSGNTCAFIGHSQGGMAITQILEKGFSCLDLALAQGSSSFRPIQTVGTPFKGTKLAYYNNILSNVLPFKVGCDAVEDLAPSGASNWLNGITMGKRKHVHYWRTQYPDSFWDRVSGRATCVGLPVGLILGTPNDSTIALADGVLDGGNNRGIKKGLCHVGPPKNRHPSQCENFDNNKNMNKYSELNP